MLACAALVNPLSSQAIAQTTQSSSQAQQPEAGVEDNPTQAVFLSAAYAQSGDRQRAQAILQQLQTRKELVSPGNLAILYAALGEREQAFASLEKAYQEHDSQLQYLGVEPGFDPLRSDRRFQDLMRRVGLSR